MTKLTRKEQEHGFRKAANNAIATYYPIEQFDEKFAKLFNALARYLDERYGNKEQ